MRLLRRERRCSEPRAKTARPQAEPYLALGATESRRLGHNYVGTEHVLLVLVRDREGGARRVLQQLGVTADAVEEALSPCIGGGAPKIDPDALATLGIDFEAVRERLEETFGPGALEQTGAACLGIAPRLKRAFAYAVDYADGRPLGDEHILLGMLSVPDSLAAHILSQLGVTLPKVEALIARGDE
jgi:ATP-dependent Clp protease ATP-binding subunit ClpA